MWRHHLHNERAKTVIDLLNDRHHTQLTEEDLSEALHSLGFKLVTTEEIQSPGVTNVDNTGSGLSCLDGPEGCNGDLATVAGSRHVRCERHWAVFYESTGM
ncbi:MAG: hypothetical protein RI637_09320 [Acidimicrobiia bacterium]|nr:hypothetical protein [Acidimicrobiia bacterium]